MKKLKGINFILVILLLVSTLAMSVSPVWGAPQNNSPQPVKNKSNAVGVLPSNAGGTPNYFGPESNYLNSPIPASVSIKGDGENAFATVTVDGAGAVSAVMVVNGGTGYTLAATSVTIVGGGGSGAVVSPAIDNITGAITAIGVISGGSGYNSIKGIRKFVDSLPQLGRDGQNNLLNYIPVAVADNTTYPGSDYYEIAVVEFTQQFSTDLNPTTLRGYVQLETTVNANAAFHPSNPSLHVQLFYPDGAAIKDSKGNDVFAYDRPLYLGPTIVAQKDIPVRVKFYNYLPLTANGGDLFLPVDKSVMGAGDGPVSLNPSGIGAPYEQYTENRSTIHLHGGVTPWISDGTPHQWITPANEDTSYPEGVSVRDVPDMAAPEAGAMTFFYTNQQSARLLFYHDHAYGITRLNVYAGEEGAYLISDPVEQDLINGTNNTGVNPGLLPIIPSTEIPLMIQDRTFLPGINAVNLNDPTWPFPVDPNKSDLWYPNVYMPNQNPNSMDGNNPLGRWDYGPWFWPPWIANNPPITLPDGSLMPNLPDISAPMEAFNDTAVVNGVAYPYLEVEAKPYRFRILNAANDRFFNLTLYKAKADGPVWDNQTLLNSGNSGEVNMVEFCSEQPDLTPWPAGWPQPDLRVAGIQDPKDAGPNMVQIGTEGGFLPAPVVLKNTPIGFDLDSRSITINNVLEHNLFLGPAERADVIVDFSSYLPGQTFILYNDSPAPVPASDKRYDYYTGNLDLTANGGAPTTLSGYGPNTRTLMQIRVIAPKTAVTAFSLTDLQTAFTSTPTYTGVFAKDQDPIIVPQSGYNSAYNANFPSNKQAYVRIPDNSLSFYPRTDNAANLGEQSATLLTEVLQPKAIHELFENEYGRMNAVLGVEIPNTNGTNQTTIPFGYTDPVTEELSVNMTAISPAAGDGTQIWKITHNGVDSHPIHFHLFNVQVINRVDWAGVIKPPEANELGWKETVRMNPLEDCIVAMRPVLPKVPWGAPDSVRPLSPSMPIGSGMGFSPVDPNGIPVTTTNQYFNFGWEYVWHCHILAHEEMDMMRPIKVDVARALPLMSGLGGAGNVSLSQIDLNWTDGTPFVYATGLPLSTLGNPAGETGYYIDRATVTGGAVGGTNGTLGPWTRVGTALANQTAFSDLSVTMFVIYRYRVTAYNAAGNTILTTANAQSTVLSIPDAPVLSAPINNNYVNTLTPSLQWNSAPFVDTYNVQVATDSGFTNIVMNSTSIVGNSVAVSPALVNLTGYYWRASATNVKGTSAWSTTGQFRVELPPAAPVLTDPPPGKTSSTVDLTWTEASANASGYIIQRRLGNGAFSQIGTSTALAFTASGLAQNTTYGLRVAATSLNAGNSAWSNIVTVTTLINPPAVPILSAPTNGATLTNLTPALQWNAAANATSYSVQLSTSSSFAPAGAILINQSGVTNTQISIAPGLLIYSTTYYWRVNAVNAGGASAWSGTRSFTTPTSPIPNAPTALTASSVTMTAVGLSWTNNAVPVFSGFKIERALGAGAFSQIGTTGSGATTFSDSGLTAGTAYRYRVRAYSAAGDSAYSNIFSVTTATPPLTVPVLTSPASGATVTNRTPILSWGAVSGATTYEVQIATNAAFTTGFRNVTGLTATSYNVTPALTAATRYYWRVRAVNGGGASAWSSAIFFNTP